jgi:RNA polymerase-binding transcription factor DksA
MRSGEGQGDDSRVPTTEHHRSRTRRASRNGVTTNGAPPVASDEERGGLSPAQLRRIEQRLLQEREMALRTLLGTWTDIQRHPIADMRKEEMDIHLAERHSEFIGLIDAALRRLREFPEGFHLSVVSGEPIPFERLEMVPWTRRLTSEMGLPTR